jgi:hypothetical protein
MMVEWKISRCVLKDLRMVFSETVLKVVFNDLRAAKGGERFF